MSVNKEPTKDDLKFVDLKELPEDSQKVLFDVLEIDITKSKCKYCGKILKKNDISIMPEIEKGEKRVLTCNSSLCLSQYFDDFEKSKKLSPLEESAIAEFMKVFWDFPKFSTAGDVKQAARNLFTKGVLIGQTNAGVNYYSHKEKATEQQTASAILEEIDT